MKTPLTGLLSENIAALLEDQPAFRAKQIFCRIENGSDSFDKMSELPEELRSELSQKFTLRCSKVVRQLSDGDSVKLQIELEDGALIEAVILSDESGRHTACLSTQVGCPIACVFCKTGSLGFLRNLSAAEITEQFLHIQSIVPKISNIVFMGMGEPLLNFDALQKSISVLTCNNKFSPRRITISTCGIIKNICRLKCERLAVSLTAADEALRSALMPGTKSNPLADLKKALLCYQAKEKKRITLEAVLLGGINTKKTDAASFADFANGLDVFVNLIPWNYVEGLNFNDAPLCTPGSNEVRRFAADLESFGLKTFIRRKKGRSVGGACGQLGKLFCL